MGRIVTYYCDRCGLTIPKEKGAPVFNLTIETFSAECEIVNKLICESCLDDLTDRWMKEGGEDYDI